MASNSFTDRDLYCRALEPRGEKAQIVMAIEECSELTQALMGAYHGRESPSRVAEEIADIKIMLDQRPKEADPGDRDG